MDLGGITGLVLPGTGAGFFSFKAPVSAGGGHPGFSAWLREWGNSRPVTVFWAVLGCICSFLCPVFLFLEEGQAVGDIGPVRLFLMLLSCICTAGVYRVGLVLRHDRIMRESPPPSAHVVGTILYTIIYFAIGVNLVDGGTWPTVVGLQLVVVVLFGFLEMAKPVYDFNMFQYFSGLPIIAGLRRHGWEFVYLGWPMLTVALTIFFITWNGFFLRLRGPILGGARPRGRPHRD
ncbi:hypothetical protein C2S52_001891 [Perilla frutescens var. hirtella]|nr:hypothetical protein C2S52_001891 [Perilla frutescens var. hirtella]